MKRNLCLIVLAAMMMMFLPLQALAEPLPGKTGPDPVQVANSFITGLTGSSPTSLGYAADAQDLFAIGMSVLEGDFSGAVNKFGEFAALKAIGHAAPAIGQIIAIGSIGKMAGEKAVDWMGNKNFDKIYDTLLETSGPVERWPRTVAEAKADSFFRSTMDTYFRYLETYLIRRGYADNADEAYDVAVEMALAKGRFERLCDEYGLKGSDRTYERLEREIRLEAEAAAEIVRERELAHAARLEEERPAKEKEEAALKEEMEAGLVEEQAAAEKEIEPAVPYETPDKQVKPAPPEQEDPAAFEPKEEPPEPAGGSDVLSWSIAPTSGRDQTVFSITVTNHSGRPVEGFSSSVDPVGAFSDGSVAWGSSPSYSTIGPGESITFTALAMGDVKAVALTFRGNGVILGSEQVSSVHERTIVADGNYSGSFSGDGVSGTISFVINGTSLTGNLKGRYSDANQNVVIGASLSGTVDPKTGAVSATWSGTGVGKMTFEGESHDVNEPLRGTFEGFFSRGTLSGTWSGGSDYVSTGGSWQAQ